MFTKADLERMTGARIDIGEDGVARKVGVAGAIVAPAVVIAPGRSTTPVRPAGWKEKDEQQMGVRVLHAVGFRVWSLSQARASKQTSGWPDLKAFHPRRKLALWWEAKRPDDPAPWTLAQQAFAEMCALVGERYVLGATDDLRAMLRAEGFDV